MNLFDIIKNWHLLNKTAQHYFISGCRLWLWIGGILTWIVWVIMHYVFN